MCATLISCTDTITLELVKPVLCVMHNIITSIYVYTQVFIESELLEKVKGLLIYPEKEVSILTYKLLSDVCTEGSHMADQFILTGLISQAISLSETDTSDGKERILLLANVSANCFPYRLPQLREMGIANLLLEVLSCGYWDLVSMSLKSLSVFMRFGKTTNPEMLKLHMDVGKLAEECRSLASEGLSAAQKLLKEALRLFSGDQETDQPRKKHKCKDPSIEH